MKRRHFLGGVGGSLAAPLSAAAPAGFRAGFAERDITPEIGMEKPGGYGKAFHKVFHDACKVRAAVFDDGARRVALAGVDALMVPRKLVLEVRAEVQKRAGIAPEAVLIGASHSHSSGPTGMVQPGEYDAAPAFVQQLAYEKSSCADPRYLARVREETAGAIADAARACVEAVCAFGSGHEDKAAYNRRFRMKNGLTATHPGQGNPNIVEPAGPIDPEVGVAGAWDKNGRLLGCIVNYACHATTDPGGISANWIYYLERTIRGALDEKAVVVFLQGASGDVTQVDNLRPYVQPGAKRWAQIVGHRVGAEALKVLVTAEQGDDVSVAARSRLLRIRRRPPSSERVRRCYETLRSGPDQAGVTEWTFAKEIVLLDALMKREPVADVEVQAVQVGPAVFVTNPAEFFCQSGLDIKRQSNFKLTYPVELANGCVGYVPTEEAFGPGGGGYETRLTSYSNLEPGAARRIVDAGVELARSLHPGPMPEPPRAKPRESWPYGNVPPELS